MIAFLTDFGRTPNIQLLLPVLFFHSAAALEGTFSASLPSPADTVAVPSSAPLCPTPSLYHHHWQRPACHGEWDSMIRSSLGVSDPLGL